MTKAQHLASMSLVERTEDANIYRERWPGEEYAVSLADGRLVSRIHTLEQARTISASLGK